VPTVLRLPGLRVVVYPNDHRPAHVYVIGSDDEAVFRLGCPDGPVELRENYGFRRGQVSLIVAAPTERLADLCKAWEEIHGIA
jgi:hypothetical protein